MACYRQFFTDSIDDEDEVLLVLAEELPNLSPYLGGSEYLPRLLVPLENLAAIEDATVRDKVSNNAKKNRTGQIKSRPPLTFQSTLGCELFENHRHSNEW